MTRRLVLASASPARFRLLIDAGFDPEVVVSGLDESVDVPREPTSAVATLARRKAEAVAATLSGSVLVLGCDSMLEFDGVAYGKPGDETQARAGWQQRRGKSGVLRTGHTLIDVATGQLAQQVASTEVTFASPTDHEIDAYIASGEPLAVAGGFTIDGRGSIFVERINGDHSNVIGLSMPLFRKLLAELAIDATELWT